MSIQTVNDKTMKQKVLDHLLTGKTISGIEASAMWRCRDLPKRISELKADGYPILRSMREDSTGQRYARYELDAEAHFGRGPVIS